MSEFEEFPEGSAGPSAEVAASTLDKLFQNSNKSPYKFYIPHDEPELARLTKLIDDNGGEVNNDIAAEDYNKGADYIDSIIPIASAVSYINENYRMFFDRIFKPEFVFESVEQGTTLKLDDYVLYASPEYLANNSAAKNSRQIAKKRDSSKKFFTADEDAYIIAMARRNQLMCDTAEFFNYVQEQLGSHTAASIRSRFRSRLRFYIDRYYKTEYNNKLIQVEGKPVLDDSDKGKKSVKANFTPHEDYFLCKGLNNPDFVKIDKDGVVKMKSPSLYHYLGSEIPTHTYHSWRDRARKYALVGDRYKYYVDYYVKASRMGFPTLKTLSEADAQLFKEIDDEFEALVQRANEAGEPVPAFIDPALPVGEDYLEPPPDLEIDALTGGKNHKSLDLNKEVITEDILREEKQNLLKKENEVDSMRVIRKRKIPETSGASRSNKSSNKSTSSSKKLKQENIAPELIKEGLDQNELSSEEDNFADAAESLPEETQAAETDAGLIRDGIDTKILNSMSREQFMEKAKSLTDSSVNVEQLCALFKDKLGIDLNLTQDMITAVSGDLATLKTYLQIYLETGNRHPVNVPGIWTHDQDEVLWSGSDKAAIVHLLALHGKKRVKYRKQVLESLRG